MIDDDVKRLRDMLQGVSGHMIYAALTYQQLSEVYERTEFTFVCGDDYRMAISNAVRDDAYESALDLAFSRAIKAAKEQAAWDADRVTA